MQKVDKYNIAQLLPPQWREWFIKNVELEMITSNDYAYVRADEKLGLVLGVNPEVYNSITESQKRTLIIHEISHIIRGDVFKKNEGDNALAWNMAWDSVINSHLNHDDVRELKGTLYEDLHQVLDLPPYLSMVSEYEIYRRLCKKMEEQNQQLKELLEKLKGLLNDVKAGCGLEDMPPETRVKVFGAILEAKAMAKELGVEVRVVSAGIDGGKPEVFRIEKMKSIQKIERLFSLCVQSGRRFVKKRSFRREGIIEGLRGMSRKRIGKVFLLCDVSGSVYPIVYDILGMAKWLIKKGYVVDFGTFSSQFNIYPTLPTSEFELKGVGGGTEIRDALTYLSKQDYDLAIVITDGEIFDYEPKLSAQCRFPIAWVLTEKNDSFVTPNKDFKIYVEE